MLDHGPAIELARKGHRVILPDSRGCGDSEKPDDANGFPADILADDGLALVSHLGFAAGEYDLAGYSLGGRIVVRMLARDAAPGRAIVAGQGLAKVCGVQGGGVNHRVLTALVTGTPIESNSADAIVAQAFSRVGTDPSVLLQILDSLVPTPERVLQEISVPTLVVIGEQDDRDDADKLAALVPNARFVRVPGDHGGAFVAKEFATAACEFLAY